MPRTRSALPIMLPVIDALTTSSSPWVRAMIAITNSVALPNDALSKPPVAGPTCDARSSVAWPIRLASGTRARADVANVAVGEAPFSHMLMLSGTHKRSKLRGDSPRSAPARRSGDCSEPTTLTAPGAQGTQNVPNHRPTIRPAVDCGSTYHCRTWAQSRYARSFLLRLGCRSKKLRAYLD